MSWDLADLAEAIAGSGSRRPPARQKPEKRKRRKRLASSESCNKPPQYLSILDPRKHLFCSASCGLIYSKQLPLGKTNVAAPARASLNVRPGTSQLKKRFQRVLRQNHREKKHRGLRPGTDNADDTRADKISAQNRRENAELDHARARDVKAAYRSRHGCRYSQSLTKISVVEQSPW